MIGIPLTLKQHPASGSGIGTNYIRDTVCISFCLNELLSIVENTSLMGIPYPPAMKKAIDVLQTKVGRAEDQIKEDDKNGNSET